MAPSLIRSALLLLIVLNAACARLDQVDRAANAPPLTAPRSDQAVIVYTAPLRASPGDGAALGTLEPNTVVKVGELVDGWRSVETITPPLLAAWVEADRIGCRALEDLTLIPTDQSKPQITLRPGALLAVLERQDQKLLIQTQGVISVDGLIESSKCGVGAPFVPTVPHDGTPHILVRRARLASELGGQSLDLPEGQRFAVFAIKNKLAYGRTDGPVALRGLIDAAALERDKTTPFDRLAEPLGYSHETLVETPLSSEPDAPPFAELPGGSPLTILNRQSDKVQIRVSGQIRLEGWVAEQTIRRVSLDHNELDPYAKRREHGPIPRDFPRGLDLIED
jgi:hypothetical protein